jgi:hypothetical protein
MPTLVIQSKRVVLEFAEGVYSFSQFQHTASSAQIHGLAMALNAFQDETPKSVRLIEKSEIA